MTDQIHADQGSTDEAGKRFELTYEDDCKAT